MDPYNTADAHRVATAPATPPGPQPPQPPQLSQLPQLPPVPPPARAAGRAGNPYAAPSARVRDAVAFAEFADAEPAQRWMRLVAVLLDTAIVMVPTWMVIALMESARRPYAQPSTGMQLFLLVYLLGIGAYVVVQLVMLHRSGQTMGKRLMGIRIVRADGSRAGLGRIFLLRAMLPNLIGAIPLVGLFFVLIDALFIFADDRRCLHDRFADTIVVDA